MSEHEEKGYEVKDKRKVKLNENGEVQVQPESEEEMPGQEEFALPPMDVFALIKSFIGMMDMAAWQFMGLVKDPMTGELRRDMTQAKLAIDSIIALSNQLEGKISEAEQLELKSLISNLQLNFVQQSAKG